MNQKKGELASLVVVGIMLVITIILVLVKGGITGAEVGVPELTVPDGEIIIPPTEEINVENISFGNESGFNLTRNFYVSENDQIKIEELILQVSFANATQCGALNQSLTLLANINSNGTCFIINQSNIILDGNGKIITGNWSGHGINISIGINNVTIRNFTGVNGFESGIFIGEESYNHTISNNTLFNNSKYGIYFESGTEGSANIIFNNISWNSYGIYRVENTSNISYNNFHNNTFNLVPQMTQFQNPDLFKAENNWWGIANCTGIRQMINNSLAAEIIIDYDPFFDSSYPNGNAINCQQQYCGMSILNSTNLTDNLNNCPGRGIEIGKDLITLDCNGYSISGDYGNDEGIYNWLNDHVTIKNCKISNFRYGIIADSASVNITINNNTIQNTTTAGILVYGNYFNIQNNTFQNNSGNSLLTDGGIFITISEGGQVISNVFRNNFIGINLFGASWSKMEKNNLSNNTIGYNLGGEPGYSVGNNFTFERAIGNTYGILINTTTSGVGTNTFKNSYFANNTLDLNLIESSNSNITFINTAINKNRLYVYVGSKAYFKWYVDITVTDSGGVSLDNVSLIVINSLGESEYTNYTETHGYGRLEATEFYRTNEINYYLTPSRIKASKNNYTLNLTSVDLLNQTGAQINLTLTPISCGSTINSDLSLGNSHICAGSGIILGASNVVINGNGYNLTGNGSGIGIELNGKNNITIRDLQLQNFSKALNLQNVNNSNFTRLRIVNNSVGIYLENSNNNNIYDSYLGNNTNVSLYLINDGGTNNSLINVTIKDFNEINVSGTATLFLKWYVDVNVTYNGLNPLPNANIYGYFNGSGSSFGLVDDMVSSPANGLVKLKLTELKKNSTGIYYLTPHNITLSYTYLNANIINYTFVNLTKTNNTYVNLSITLNCTSPSPEMSISSTTTFCPGTFSITEIQLTGNNFALTCVDTILRKTNSNGLSSIFYNEGYKNINLTGCSLESEVSGTNAISINNGINITINNFSISTTTYGSGINCYDSVGLQINGSSFYNYNEIYLLRCNNTIITQNKFNGKTGMTSNGIRIERSHHNLFKNNTFNSGLTKAVSFTQDYPSDNNTFYYNNFSAATTYIEYFSTAEYLNFFNISSGGYAQGNEYSDYCNKGKDLNADGYADTNSTPTANDWPYSENITSKISDSTANNGGVIDYGPKITTCPAAEVFLGNTGGSSSSTTTAPAAAPAAAAPPGFSTYEKPPEKTSEDFSTLEEIKKHLKTDEIIVKRTSEDTMQVAIKLENNGDQKMKLFPGLDQETEVPLYIVTKKTVGGEDSFFNKLSGIAYSENTIAGKLLQAEIIGAEEFILNPGESVEKILEIKDALIPPKQIKIKFSSFGETVTEQEIKVEPKKVLTGSALDIDIEQDLIDVYAIMVPEKNGESNQNNALTGAAVGPKDTKSNLYYLEITMTKKGSDKDAFVDWYGPYHTKPGQNFIFAQQFKYGQPFRGDYLLKTKIFRGNELVTEAEHEVKLE